ncbi:MAG: hypothetical protein ACRDV9_02885 [Acidimicrobiia bacterium]
MSARPFFSSPSERRSLRFVRPHWVAPGLVGLRRLARQLAAQPELWSGASAGETYADGR